MPTRPLTAALLGGLGLLATATATACYSPPVAPAPPTAAPTPTPIQATAVAAVQSGPAATQIAVAAATSTATSPVRIADASFSPDNAASSAITLENIGTHNVDLGGWVLLVDTYRITLPQTDYMTVVPGDSLVVHLTNSPTPTSGHNVYVGLGAASGTPRINADQIVLLDPAGQVASTYPGP